MTTELGSHPPAGRTRAGESGFEQAAQSLCLACGLCCDGTLFGRVNLGPEDDLGALALSGIQVLSDTVPPALKQRCPVYKNCSCSIYPNRPHACRSFRCALLKAFEANEIAHAEALKIIRDAVMLRDDVKEAVRDAFGDGDCSFDEFTLRLKARWQEADTVAAKDRIAALFRKFAALWLFINKHFQDRWQR